MKQLSKLAARVGLRPKMQRPQPAEPEVVRNPRKPAVGLYALLTDEQKAKSLNGSGNENFGPDKYALGSRGCA